MPTRYCTVAEAAELLGVTPARIRQLLDGGRSPGAKKFGTAWMVPLDRDGRPKIEIRSVGRPRKA